MTIPGLSEAAATTAIASALAVCRPQSPWVERLKMVICWVLKDRYTPKDDHPLSHCPLKVKYSKREK